MLGLNPLICLTNKKAVNLSKMVKIHLQVKPSLSINIQNYKQRRKEQRRHLKTFSVTSL